MYDCPYRLLCERFRYSTKCDLSIIRVNKLLHIEATRGFYAMVHFRFFKLTALSLFLDLIGLRNKACITTIYLDVECLDGGIGNMDETCETLSSLPGLNKLVVYMYVKLFSTEYLNCRYMDRRFKDLEWHVYKWTTKTRNHARKLLLFVELLIGQGADEDDKRRMLDMLEVKGLGGYQGDDWYLLGHCGNMNGRAGDGRVDPTCEELAAGIRDDVEKLIVKSDYLAARSSKYDTELVWLR